MSSVQHPVSSVQSHRPGRLWGFKHGRKITRYRLNLDEASGNVTTAVTRVTETNLLQGERSQRPNLPGEEVKQSADCYLNTAFLLSAIRLKCCRLLAASSVRSPACKACQGTCLDICSSPSTSAAVVWDRAANVHTTICSRGSCRQAHQSTEGECCSQVCTAEVSNGRRRPESDLSASPAVRLHAQSFIYAAKEVYKASRRIRTHSE